MKRIGRITRRGSTLLRGPRRRHVGGEDEYGKADRAIVPPIPSRT
ncbi:MAG TPA: hypothetical protein VGR35_16400 [Tepidisphaeraceae bacterium]|nr:hypothetical protein [Tepidisphaeraceae bacterium]